MGVGSQRHALAALRPGKKPNTNRTRGCVVPRAGLDGWGKSRPQPLRGSIPGPFSLQRVDHVF